MAVVSVGAVSVGCVAAGLIAVGTVAVGGLAIGAIAFGWKAAAGAIATAFDYAGGKLARADHANDEAAAAFFTSIRAESIFPVLLAVTAVLVVATSGTVARLARKRRSPSTE